MRIPPKSWKTFHLFTPCELLSSPTPIIAKQNIRASRRAWEVELHLLRFLPSLFLIILTAINQQASVFQPNLILDSNLLSSSAGNKITSIRHPAVFLVN